MNKEYWFIECKNEGFMFPRLIRCTKNSHSQYLNKTKWASEHLLFSNYLSKPTVKVQEKTIQVSQIVWIQSPRLPQNIAILEPKSLWTSRASLERFATRI